MPLADVRLLMPSAKSLAGQTLPALLPKATCRLDESGANYRRGEC
jgi:hypothetical protein